MTTLGALAAAEPELAAFVSERLRASPSYLATEASVSGTGDVALPERRRWRAGG
jgi:hypothetical protein